jgi:hypothetical protein
MEVMWRFLLSPEVVAEVVVTMELEVVRAEALGA